MRDFEVMVNSHIAYRIKANTQAEAEAIAIVRYGSFSISNPYISWVKEYVKK